MKRKLASAVRLAAVALALILVSDATGAFAAVVLVVEQDECCRGSQSAPSCPMSLCVMAGCLPRALDLQDDAMNLGVPTARERWPAVDQVGSARADEPPVPPPRG